MGKGQGDQSMPAEEQTEADTYSQAQQIAALYRDIYDQAEGAGTLGEPEVVEDIVKRIGENIRTHNTTTKVMLTPSIAATRFPTLRPMRFIFGFSFSFSLCVLDTIMLHPRFFFCSRLAQEFCWNFRHTLALILKTFGPPFRSLMLP